MPGGTLTQLGGAVLVAFFVHALLYSSLTSLCGWAGLPCISFEYALSAFSPDLDNAVTPRELGHNISEYRWWIVAYFFATSLLALFLGWIAGKGPFRFIAKHRWIYNLVDENDGSFVLAHILTNIRTDKRVLMYRGFLQEYFFTPDGKISYLVLSGCSRYYLKLENDKPLTSPAEDWLVVGQNSAASADDVAANEKQWSFMVIEGEDISNVVFDRYTLTFTDEALTQLEDIAS